MFPTTDSSATIVDCLMRSAQESGVEIHTRSRVDSIEYHQQDSDQYFTITFGTGDSCDAKQIVLATGGTRAGHRLATSLGHSIIPPVPSLFTFKIDDVQLTELAGLTVEDAIVWIGKAKELKQRGPVLITHWGLSGPAVLRLSAWGARLLADCNYRVTIHVNWLPNVQETDIRECILAHKRDHPKRLVESQSPWPLPKRLWKTLCHLAGTEGTLWADLSKSALHRLVQQLHRTEFQTSGKSVFKEEFVTCGGIALNEVDLKTMRSRINPQLLLAGEILDVDGITGGFNFQNAWTTGYLAGCSAVASKTTSK